MQNFIQIDLSISDAQSISITPSYDNRQTMQEIATSHIGPWGVSLSNNLIPQAHPISIDSICNLIFYLFNHWNEIGFITVAKIILFEKW